MGYTHYFKLTDDLTEEVLADVRKVLSKYPEMITYECDSKAEPIVSKEFIRFNGYEDDGYETFFLEVNDRAFCKTNERCYDLPVCEVLLVLKHHYRDKFELSSDGLYVSEEQMNRRELYGNWGEALDNVRDEFGYEFILNEHSSGSYFYYSIDGE